jgi:hypothetical protein
MLKYGHVRPCWDDSYKQLPFEKQQLMQVELDTWRSQGYAHNSFSGSMYSSVNPMPQWVNTVAQELNIHKPGFVIYRMDTMDVMPLHIDHFNTYMRVFNAELHQIVRALVFLEDWKSGHYFEAGNQAYTSWRAGDYVMWTPEVIHAASNIGIQPRYTLQITGTL